MTATIEVILPKVDMDMDSGTIVAWKVAEGDRVQQGDIVFEMETGKALMEVEAPGTGVIRDLASITGEPTYTVDMQLMGRDGDHNTGGLKATAMRLVNSIPAVVEGEPGLLTALDLPPVYGKGLVR